MATNGTIDETRSNVTETLVTTAGNESQRLPQTAASSLTDGRQLPSSSGAHRDNDKVTQASAGKFDVDDWLTKNCSAQ
jgi:hypothetical protein